MKIKAYSYDKESDRLNVTFDGVEGDSFTKQIADGVFLLKCMVTEKLNGLIVEKASIDTALKQKAITDAEITDVDIVSMIGD